MLCKHPRQLTDTNLNIISGKIKIFGFKHDTSATAHVIYVSWPRHLTLSLYQILICFKWAHQNWWNMSISCDEPLIFLLSDKITMLTCLCFMKKKYVFFAFSVKFNEFCLSYFTQFIIKVKYFAYFKHLFYCFKLSISKSHF